MEGGSERESAHAHARGTEWQQAEGDRGERGEGVSERRKMAVGRLAPNSRASTSLRIVPPPSLTGIVAAGGVRSVGPVVPAVPEPDLRIHHGAVSDPPPLADVVPGRGVDRPARPAPVHRRPELREHHRRVAVASGHEVGPAAHATVPLRRARWGDGPAKQRAAESRRSQRRAVAQWLRVDRAREHRKMIRGSARGDEIETDFSVLARK